MGKRLTRTEFGYRVSKLSDYKIMRNFARDWFFDKDVCYHICGNIHRAMGKDIYGHKAIVASRADPFVVDMIGN